MSTVIPYTGIVIPFALSRGRRAQSEDTELLTEASAKCLAIYQQAAITPAADLYGKLTQEIKDIAYFPEERMDPLFQLIYLTTLTKEGHKSPYSRETALQLQKAYDATRNAKTWLRIAFITSAIFPLVIYGLSKVNGASNADWFILTSLAINILGALASVIGTGTNPDLKSDELNRRQDLLNNKLPLLSLEMSEALIEMDRNNHLFAEHIAQRLDLDVVEELMLRGDPSSSKDVQIGSAREAVIGRLSVARASVLRQALPRPSTYTTDVLHYLREHQAHDVVIDMPSVESQV